MLGEIQAGVFWHGLETYASRSRCVFSVRDGQRKLVTLSDAIEVTGSVKLQHNVSALC